MSDTVGHPPPSLQQDLPCANCCYNLRGLPPDARCPECGTEVASTLRIAATYPPNFRRDMAKPMFGVAATLLAPSITIALLILGFWSNSILGIFTLVILLLIMEHVAQFLAVLRMADLLIPPIMSNNSPHILRVLSVAEGVAIFLAVASGCGDVPWLFTLSLMAYIAMRSFAVLHLGRIIDHLAQISGTPSTAGITAGRICFGVALLFVGCVLAFAIVATPHGVDEVLWTLRTTILVLASTLALLALWFAHLLVRSALRLRRSAIPIAGAA